MLLRMVVIGAIRPACHVGSIVLVIVMIRPIVRFDFGCVLCGVCVGGFGMFAREFFG